MRQFFAHFLFVLAAWTVVIKYLFPAAFAWHAGEPLGTHIYPDFWPVVHIWLGWALLNWRPWTFWAAGIIATAEIIIVSTKFVFFLAAPEWTIWRTNWFINKIFVLTCFVLLLVWLLARTPKLSFRQTGHVG
jgi:hypothetical protein